MADEATPRHPSSGTSTSRPAREHHRRAGRSPRGSFRCQCSFLVAAQAHSWTRARPGRQPGGRLRHSAATDDPRVAHFLPISRRLTCRPRLMIDCDASSDADLDADFDAQFPGDSTRRIRRLLPRHQRPGCRTAGAHDRVQEECDRSLQRTMCDRHVRLGSTRSQVSHRRSRGRGSPHPLRLGDNHRSWSRQPKWRPLRQCRFHLASRDRAARPTLSD